MSHSPVRAPQLPGCSTTPLDRGAALLTEGRALLAADRPAEALVTLRQADRMVPGSAAITLEMAVALHRTGEVEAALPLYRAVLRANPHDTNARNGLGAALMRLGQLEEAEAALRQAIAMRPDFVEALNNLGRLASATGRLAEAVRHFDAALAARPDHSVSLWHRACARLLAGDMPGGWDDFEARWAVPQGGSVQAFPVPSWNGEALAGRTLLLHPEQGFGDTIQFARYAAVFAAGGAQVVIGVQAELKRIMATLPGAAAVVARGEALPRFDYHLPLMSAPGRLRQGLGDLPAKIPYLGAEAAVADRWRARLGPHGLRVGIVWAGNPNHANDANRSVPLARLAPLLALQGVRFFSLQLGAGRAEVKGFPQIEDLSDGLTDFAETAGAMAALDLLVTVDSSPAHLAGALGRPVWLMLPSAPDWRWMLGRRDTPWYPSMRLFRQPGPGDWSGVVEAMVEELGRVLQGRAA